ncbi:MAG: hypothetical protein EXR54_02230 [Dehalococcoidia bacterium]|nr:hypothetical protein [Dehalococcoidia bacterium]MSQ16377.1 hypothetical protein [Dehalococcoidia bacterium]
MRWREPPRAECTKGERWGSALAHGSGLVVGVPLAVSGFLPLYIALSPCPVVAYYIGRAFRRRGLAWGAFQALQAALVLLLIVVLATLGSLQEDQLSRLSATLWAFAALLFLYSLWGAWDTAFGYNFRYIGLSRLVARVSEANIRRHERRKEWLAREKSDNRADKRPRS